MTFHFTDAPDSTLPSRQETIDGTADSEINEIRVAFSEELAYTKDGGFRAPYQGSTLSGGKVLSLARAGGWPRAFDVHVEEAGASASSWTVLYERDLTTLPDQIINGPTGVNTYGAFTMDGQPWYWHGSTGQANLVHGQGLVGSASGTAFYGNPYAGYYIGLRVFEMPGYDEAKETVCQVKYTGNPSAMAGNQHVGCGIWSGGIGYGYGPGNNAQLTLLRNGNVSWTDGVTTPWNNRLSGDDLNEFTLGARVQPWSDLDADKRFGRFNYREGLFLRGAPEPCDVESMLGMGCTAAAGTAQAGNYMMGFFAGTEPPGFGTMNFVGTFIRILQRAVT